MKRTRDVSFWVLAATILGSSMSFIDSTVVYVVLPVVQKELHATVVQTQWIVEAYVLVQASLILLGGALSDRFGRKRIFALGTILFAAASAFCGVSTTANGLILGRLLQAIGGALLAPSSLAVITAYFDEKRRGHAIGAWSGASAISAAIGPVLGGFLAEKLSWRFVFFINIPLAVITLLILFIWVPESKDHDIKGGLDWAGAFLGTIGLGGMTYGLIESSTFGFGSPLVLGSILLGLVSLGLFLWTETRASHPIVPLNLFRSLTFSGANLLTLLLYGGLSAMIFFLPFNLVQVQGYSIIQASLVFLPLILILGIFSQWGGSLWHKHGAKLPLTIGPLIVSVAFLLFARIGIGGEYIFTFFPAVVVLAIGMTLIAAPLTTTVMSAAPQRLSGTASGINNTLLSVANLLAVAILGIVALHAFGSSLDQRIAPLDLPPAALQQISLEKAHLADMQPPQGLNEEQRVAVKLAVGRSFIDAFRRVMFICSGLALASAGVAWKWIEAGGDRRPKTHRKKR